MFRDLFCLKIDTEKEVFTKKHQDSFSFIHSFVFTFRKRSWGEGGVGDKGVGIGIIGIALFFMLVLIARCHCDK